MGQQLAGETEAESAPGLTQASLAKCVQVPIPLISFDPEWSVTTLPNEPGVGKRIAVQYDITYSVANYVRENERLK